MFNKIIKKINNRSASVCVIGLGYVGLPLLIRFKNANFKNLIGFDRDEKKIKKLQNAQSYISHITDKEIDKLKKKVTFINNIKKLKKHVDFFIICLPTPINKNKTPNLKAIKSCIEDLKKITKKNQTIVFESTSYPYSTKELFYDSFLKKNYDLGKNFFLVYSPEREDPGNKEHNMKNVTKLISGYSKKCQHLGELLYKTCHKKIHKIENIETAEMSKLFENCFRAINISYVNEMKDVCNKMNINILDVIQACRTKPFGFMPFYPGPGVGGHCIPVDPYLLSWKSKKFKVNTRFLNLALQLNENLTNKIFNKIKKIIRKNIIKKKVKILILGVSYKKNVDDIRESPSIKILEKLYKNKFIVSYFDPYVSFFNLKKKFQSEKSLKISNFDVVVLATDHDKFDYKNIKKNAKLLIDTRGRFVGDNKKIYNV